MMERTESTIAELLEGHGQISCSNSRSYPRPPASYLKFGLEAVAALACPTQMVRPVVADVGLGPVTLNDTNQILGTRRFGPDLSDVGSRLGESEIEAIILGGAGEHPALSLAQEDLDDLVAYLSESAPGGGS